MQSLAFELGLAETAYVVPRPDGDYDLRWFTPTVEIPLCGHATLASAHTLFETGRGPTDRSPSTRCPARSRAPAGRRARRDGLPRGRRRRRSSPPPGCSTRSGSPTRSRCSTTSSGSSSRSPTAAEVETAHPGPPSARDDRRRRVGDRALGPRRRRHRVARLRPGRRRRRGRGDRLGALRAHAVLGGEARDAPSSSRTRPPRGAARCTAASTATACSSPARPSPCSAASSTL